VISGGGGLWAIAQAANTTVVLRETTFSKLSGPKIEVLECCGFTVEVIVAP